MRFKLHTVFCLSLPCSVCDGNVSSAMIVFFFFYHVAAPEKFLETAMNPFFPMYPSLSHPFKRFLGLMGLWRCVGRLQVGGH